VNLLGCKQVVVKGPPDNSRECRDISTGAEDGIEQVTALKYFTRI
jgi:hypothetical protein